MRIKTIKRCHLARVSAAEWGPLLRTTPPVGKAVHLAGLHAQLNLPVGRSRGPSGPMGPGRTEQGGQGSEGQAWALGSSLTHHPTPCDLGKVLPARSLFLQQVEWCDGYSRACMKIKGASRGPSTWRMARPQPWLSSRCSWEPEVRPHRGLVGCLSQD